MMKRLIAKYRFGLVLTIVFMLQLFVVGAFFLLIAVDLEPVQRALLTQFLAQRAVPLGALALLLLLAIGVALNKLFNRYLAPVERLAEDAVTLASNPGHRAVSEGAGEVRRLADKLNVLAAAHQKLYDDVQAQIESSNRALAAEKNRLAALMSELESGVLVCNLEGRILLYNLRAKQLLVARHDAHCAANGAAVGLGRSVFGVIERGHIVHALEQIRYQLDQGDTGRPLAGFVAALAGERMVRTRMAPVLNDAQALDGFVLTLDDITRNIEVESRRDALIQTLTQDTRAALANIRAAVEAMQTFPIMSSTKRVQFTAIIDEESQRLARGIESAMQQHSDEMDSRWQLEEMRGADLVALLLRRIDSPGLRATADAALDTTLWLNVDSYALTQALAYLVQRLCGELGMTELRLELQRAGRLAQLDLCWSGGPLATQTLRQWENEPLSAGGAALTVSAVLARHGGAAVYRSESSRYRLLLPLAEPQARREIFSRQQGRPEFYDFDLFHQPGQNAELDQRLLSQLSYTVFDTETTGLQPAAGDEIISIGAVRIVNGRLLQQENFEQLVQPGHVLSAESVGIHGITDAMLDGQPTIEIVLPQFHRFAEDTVLVAHNAAFDLRFLQMQEANIGILFTQPVLDTLLLSQVVHPHQQQHTLEAIAARLGVTVVGRHTALGDAIVTGEVFLKMLPLLADKNIHTLKEARDAAQQTYYARLRY
jgi:DNA polymerase-3 subunit epsilon